jgi:hypothetical protein
LGRVVLAKPGTGLNGGIVQEEIPRNVRIGRRLANGRFEITEWIGPDFLMGIAIARDEQGALARLTFAGDVSRSAEELQPILARDAAGLAPVRYLGATAADDGWAPRSMMMAELLPRGEPLDLLAHGGDAKYVATFGARLCGLVAGVHRSGTVLGTIRPESTFVTADGDIELVARGERLWHMPRPNMMRSTMLSPWPSGYLAPELLMKPLPNDPDPAADVFSIGVMLATSLLGQSVYEEQIDPRLFVAQMQGNHLPLPETALGETLARCLRPDPGARPSVVELEQALRDATL